MTSAQARAVVLEHHPGARCYRTLHMKRPYKILWQAGMISRKRALSDSCCLEDRAWINAAKRILRKNKFAKVQA